VIGQLSGLLSAQQFPQLGDIGRDMPGLES
jgi:hypothetical protein